jgi:hypothetical protein
MQADGNWLSTLSSTHKFHGNSLLQGGSKANNETHAHPKADQACRAAGRLVHPCHLPDRSLAPNSVPFQMLCSGMSVHTCWGRLNRATLLGGEAAASLRLMSGCSSPTMPDTTRSAWRTATCRAEQSSSVRCKNLVQCIRTATYRAARTCSQPAALCVQRLEL